MTFVKSDVTERPYEGRLQALRSALDSDGLTGLVVFDPVNIRYLTGFTGSAGVALVLPDECVLASDFRYTIQAHEQARESRFVELNGAFSAALPEPRDGLRG